MHIKPLIILLFANALISCNEDSKQERTPAENEALPGGDTTKYKTASQDTAAADTVRHFKASWDTAFTHPNIDRGNYTRITPGSKIKIVSLAKGRDNSSSPGEPACDTWMLTDDQIAAILRASKEIDGHELHYRYLVLPCAIHGVVSIDGRLATYRVNAGAYTTLIYKDTSVWLGYKRKDFKKYFIEGRDTLE